MILVRSDDAFQVPRTETQPIWSVPGSLLFRRRQSARISAWCIVALAFVGVLAAQSHSGAVQPPLFPPAQVGSSVASRPPLTAFSSEVAAGPSSADQTDALRPSGLQDEVSLPSSGDQSSASSSVVIGRTREAFWLALREARHRTLTPEQLNQMVFDYYQFTVDEGLDAITRIAQASRTSARITAGWRTPSSLSGTPRLLQIKRATTPILNEPTLASDNLVVLSLATQGEFYPLLKTFSRPATIGPPLQATPDLASTTWAQVRTKRGSEGWIYMRGISSAVTAAAEYHMQTPQSGTLPREAPSRNAIEERWRLDNPEAWLLGGGIIVVLFLVFKMLGGSSPQRGPGTYVAGTDYVDCSTDDTTDEGEESGPEDDEAVEAEEVEGNRRARGFLEPTSEDLLAAHNLGEQDASKGISQTGLFELYGHLTLHPEEREEYLKGQENWKKQKGKQDER